MSATEILVVILSIFLVLFLLAGIILTTLLIRITSQIKRVTSSAEKTVQTIQAMTDNAAKLSSLGFLTSVLNGQINKLRKRK